MRGASIPPILGINAAIFRVGFYRLASDAREVLAANSNRVHQITFAVVIVSQRNAA